MLTRQQRVTLLWSATALTVYILKKTLRSVFCSLFQTYNSKQISQQFDKFYVFSTDFLQQVFFRQTVIYKFSYQFKKFDSTAYSQQYNVPIFFTYHCRSRTLPGKCEYTKTLCKCTSAKKFLKLNFLALISAFIGPFLYGRGLFSLCDENNKR